MKYLRLDKIDVMEVKLDTIFRFACCDCGLVHNIAIAKEKNGRIGLAIERNNKSTAQFRRHLRNKTKIREVKH